MYDGTLRVSAAEKLIDLSKALRVWLIAVGVAIFIHIFALQLFSIPSPSMAPTINTHDRILVDKISYRLHAIHRHDIIVFKHPPGLTDEPDIKYLIKRVIATPGDAVEEINGLVYVNGVKQAETYLAPGAATYNLPRRVIPAHQLLVMGDNRLLSKDGRVFGTFDESLVVGRADAKLWPIPDVTLF